MNELDDGDFTPSSSSTSLASGEEELTAEEFTDYRVLPPANHPIRRSYHQYKLLRRLGAGKFSNVFEAVDILAVASAAASTAAAAGRADVMI